MALVWLSDSITKRASAVSTRLSACSELGTQVSSHHSEGLGAALLFQRPRQSQRRPKDDFSTGGEPRGAEDRSPNDPAESCCRHRRGHQTGESYVHAQIILSDIRR